MNADKKMTGTTCGEGASPSFFPNKRGRGARATLNSETNHRRFAFHLHVRDLQGRHSLEAQDYRAAIDAIRSRVGSELIIQVTTESGGRYTPAQQIDCAEAVAPEALSLAVRELFGDAAGRDKAPSRSDRLHEAAPLLLPAGYRNSTCSLKSSNF